MAHHLSQAVDEIVQRLQSLDALHRKLGMFRRQRFLHNDGEE